MMIRIETSKIDIPCLEANIDHPVYQHNLTPEEIAIIEGQAKGGNGE